MVETQRATTLLSSEELSLSDMIFTVCSTTESGRLGLDLPESESCMKNTGRDVANVPTRDNASARVVITFRTVSINIQFTNGCQMTIPCRETG